MSIKRRGIVKWDKTWKTSKTDNIGIRDNSKLPRISNRITIYEQGNVKCHSGSSDGINHKKIQKINTLPSHSSIKLANASTSGPAILSIFCKPSKTT